MRRRHRDCEICGQDYEPTHGQQRTCGRACGVIMRRAITGTLPASWPSSRIYIRNCDHCGKLYTARYGWRKRCGDECAYEARIATIKANIARRYRTDPAFRDKTITAAHRRRAADLGHEEIATQGELLAYLVKRDRGRCGICHQPVRAKAGQRRPSIDHIIPLARGGTHDLANLQLAHLCCNYAKGARGAGEQLLLIG